MDVPEGMEIPLDRDKMKVIAAAIKLAPGEDEVTREAADDFATYLVGTGMKKEKALAMVRGFAEIVFERGARQLVKQVLDAIMADLKADAAISKAAESSAEATAEPAKPDGPTVH